MSVHDEIGRGGRRTDEEGLHRVVGGDLLRNGNELIAPLVERRVDIGLGVVGGEGGDPRRREDEGLDGRDLCRGFHEPDDRLHDTTDDGFVRGGHAGIGCDVEDAGDAWQP